MTSTNWIHSSEKIAAALVVTVALTALTGCIGLGIAEHSEVSGSISRPLIGSKRAEMPSGQSNSHLTSASDVLKQWGNPDHWTWTEDQTQEWVYWSSGIIWTGYDIWAIILPLPLPFAVPTGRDRIVLTVRAGEVVEAKQYRDRVEGTFFCGFLPTNILQGGDTLVCGRVRWMTAG